MIDKTSALGNPDLKPEDLRIVELLGPSGFSAPRQGVSVRHIPTGIAVEEWHQISQHHNRQRAIDRLKALISFEAKSPTPEPSPLWKNPGHATAQVKVEFCCGDDILAACREASRLAKLLGCFVVFDFNGVHCMASPKTDPEALAASWDLQLKRPEGMPKVAS